VFDGNQRPQIKRGHRVSTNDHWMVKPTQRLLNAFNVQWITVHFFLIIFYSHFSLRSIYWQAAGEAEAQLAQMNGAGVIDAVMTDDSDAFVFGAHTVLRK
jgi:Holliday junction resolvase YEN1